MKRTKLFVMLVLALLLVTLPLTAMAAAEDSVIPEEGDISVVIPGGPQTPQIYTVVFEDGQGNVLTTTEYNYGDAIVFPTEAPAKAEDNYGTYVFANWVDKQDTTGKPAPSNCIGNATYIPAYNITWKEYTITFKNDDGSVIETQTLHWDEPINAPIPVNYEDDENTYEFERWDKNMPATCQGSDTFTAVFTAIPKETAKNGWVQENGKWFFYEDGEMVKNAWRQDSKGWCFLGEDGAMLTNQWKKDSKGWCYIGSSGYIVYSKWVKDSTGWCYVDASGYMVYNKWVKDSTGWCYVGADGYMVYNKWVKDSIGWCYVDGSGYMVYNKWVKDSIGWCYVDGSGYMVYNKWVKDSKGWCYVDGSGYMVYNKWVADSKGWCYVDGSGYMVTNGWAKDSLGWYWMGADGYAIKNTSKTIGGKTYYFNASGLCTNP